MSPQVVHAPETAEPSTVVLDTNVVLALYWFQDPDLQALRQALASGRLRWCATAPMREELCHVMTLGTLADMRPRKSSVEAGSGALQVLAAFDRQVHLRTATNSLRAPRCTDPQDQMFVDLALDSGAHWLFSRDKAVLKLGRRVLTLSGCKIMRPQDWKA